MVFFSLFCHASFIRSFLRMMMMMAVVMMMWSLNGIYSEEGGKPFRDIIYYGWEPNTLTLCVWCWKKRFQRGVCNSKYLCLCVCVWWTVDSFIAVVFFFYRLLLFLYLFCGCLSHSLFLNYLLALSLFVSCLCIPSPLLIIYIYTVSLSECVRICAIRLRVLL